MSEDCEVCQRHAQAYDEVRSDTERRMLMVIWRFHDRMAGHGIVRYHDPDDGLVVVDMGATVPPW